MLLDELPMTRFHWRITLISMGGPLIDGYVLAIVALALPVMPGRVTPLWQGLIGSSALIGMFIGGLVFGAVTDRVGRRKMWLS